MCSHGQVFEVSSLDYQGLKNFRETKPSVGGRHFLWSKPSAISKQISKILDTGSASAAQQESNCHLEVKDVRN